jgi:hypothetical protein
MLDDGQQLAGPRKSTVFLGARNDIVARESRPEAWTYYFGSMAGVYFWRRTLEDDQADCLFRGGSTQIGVCKPAAEMWGSQFYESFLGGEAADMNKAAVTLNGAAYMDGAFGVKLGGQEDSISVETSDYSSGGSFTVAFWYTKTECLLPGRFEMIFSHENHRGRWCVWAPERFSEHAPPPICLECMCISFSYVSFSQVGSPQRQRHGN